MFKALDKIDYENLQIWNDSSDVKPDDQKDGYEVRSLTDLACVALNWSEDLDKAVRMLPVHLAPKLLEIAISNYQLYSVPLIISNWPLEVLRLQDILKGVGLDMFQNKVVEGIKIYCAIKEGLRRPTKHCKLKCLDCGGIDDCEQYFADLPFWALRSLSRVQWKRRNLLSYVKKAAVGLDLKTSSIPKLVDWISQTTTYTEFHIPRGRRLEIKLDNVSLNLSMNLDRFNDFVVTQLLRDVTPVFVTVKNLIIKATSYNSGPNLQALFKLRRHSPENLRGLSVRQLDYGVFFSIAKDIGKIESLEDLDLQDCNIYLTEGITRSCTHTRADLMQALSSFQHLRRLDIGFNYLVGCLGEMLDALSVPLEYLSVKGADLNEKDLSDLVHSKHSPHLMELNLSKLCHYPIYERDKIYPVNLLSITKHFPKLRVLNLSRNHLPRSEVSEFCEILSSNLLELKVLDLSGNQLEFDELRDILQASAKTKKLQLLKITNMEPALNDDDQHDAVLQRFRNLTNSLNLKNFRIELVEPSFLFPFFL